MLHQTPKLTGGVSVKPSDAKNIRVMTLQYGAMMTSQSTKICDVMMMPL